jgi:hypothetical protein
MIHDRFPMGEETDTSLPPISAVPDYIQTEWNEPHQPYRAAVMGAKQAEEVTMGMSVLLDALTLFFGALETGAEQVGKISSDETRAFNELRSAIINQNNYSCTGIAIQRVGSGRYARWRVLNRSSGAISEANGFEFDQTAGFPLLIDAFSNVNDPYKANGAPFYLLPSGQSVAVCQGARPCVYQNTNP